MIKKAGPLVAIGCAAFVSFQTNDWRGEPGPRISLEGLKTRADGIGASSEQILRAMTEVGHDEWRPRVSGRSRGPGESLYPRVAPSVVVVRTDFGHGTGFVVDENGWVVTNHHVIEDADVDISSGAQVASVYLGDLKSGLMSLDERPLPAIVYKDDPVKDLALLRLPAGGRKYRPIRVAASSPTPGADCVAIGHPAAGALWTIRSCAVAGVARWPADMIDVVMHRLAVAGSPQAKAPVAQGSVQRKVLLSTCGLNPGDSGGPLVNAAGELIGVSFAIPRGGADEGISLDKFSYHVHLDEVAAFLANRPSKAPVHAPSPWPPALYSQKLDLDGDKVPDTVAFYVDPKGSPVGLLMDLQQKSDPKFEAASLADPNNRKHWHFDFALHLRSGRMLTFYDTAGAGTIDLVLLDKDDDGIADASASMEQGRWVWRTGGSKRMLSAAYFQKATVRSRFEKIIARLAASK